LLNKAIDVGVKAFRAWDATPLEERAEIFVQAAKLIRGKYRYEMLAATMLGQAKTAFQAEIDAVCELSDFYDFNAQWALVGRI
jgi:1-pyrroline-5-carboxylate dehydrogenase